MKIIKNKIFWAVRRLSLGIPKDALVLEVGSGGNPYPRSNVLLDAYEETQERHWVSLVNDRPTVISFGENLPFKDKVFDYVIAAHVLEHSPYPEKFLSELERVSKAGYIETPDAFMERINPYKDHRLEVTLEEGTLFIRKKSAWINDVNLVDLYEKRAKSIIAKYTIPQHPFEFHTRYFWKNKIDYVVLNPETDASWTPPLSNSHQIMRQQSLIGLLRLGLLKIIRYFFSQRGRNANLDITSLIQCPNCKSESVALQNVKTILCASCQKEYLIKNNRYYLS